MAFNKKLTFEGLQYYHSKIKTLFSNVNQSISNEVSRATAKENEIASNLSSHTSNTSNPHSVTKAQVGLGNVEKKSSATIRGEITKSNVTTALGYTPLNQSLKGSASGLAELDSTGKVPSSQLPSFVDEVVEGYLSGGKFYKESAHTTEISGESGKIYIDLSTEKTYRWSGSAFVVISETLALGETSSTAYRGHRGKTAYDHSQSTHARTDATKVEKSSTNGNIKINGAETTVYTHPSGTNPHGTTKSDVGLGNVDNTSDKDKPISTAQQAEFNKLNSNLDTLEFGEVAGGKNIIDIQNPLTISGAWYKSYNFKCKRNTSYILSLSTDSYTVNHGCAIYDLNGTKLSDFSYSNITFNSGDNEELCLYLYSGTDTSGTSIYSNIQIEKGTQATEYEPYIPSVKMLADEVSAQNESLSVIGKRKNLLNPTLQTTTMNDVTCTANGDGTYTLNGTATSNIWFTLGKAKLYGGRTYRLCGLNKVNNSTMYIQLRNENIIMQTTNDGIDVNITETSKDYLVVAFIPDNATYNNVIYKPMITTDLNATYDDFVPYTGDGYTLTHDVAELKNDLDKLNSLPIGSIIQIEAAKDNIETTTQKYGWQYLGTSNIECNDGSIKLLVTNVYRKNN